MIKYILSIFCIFLMFCSYAFAGTIDPLTPDDKYIDYGSKFHCIVKLCGTDQKDIPYCASGVIIDKNHVLTAAHVVYQSKSCIATVADKKICIEKFVVHKDFQDHKYGFCDIAIGNSKEDFSLDFYPSLYENNDEVSKVCSISGYGVTGTFVTGGIKIDGKKRAGSNIINHVDRDLLVCDPSPRSHNSRITELEFLIASGDSGGGLFIDGKLAGINSCVMRVGGSPKSTYNEESGHTRISKFISWIKENKITHHE